MWQLPGKDPGISQFLQYKCILPTEVAWWGVPWLPAALPRDSEVQGRGVTSMSLSSVGIEHSWGQHVDPAWEVLVHPTQYIQTGPENLPLSYIICLHAHDKLYLDYILAWLV